MNFLDELLLSFITILFTLLIAKLASASAAAAGDRTRTPAQSVELEVLGSKVKDTKFEKADLDLVESDAMVNELGKNDHVCEKDGKFELLEEENTVVEEIEKELELREIEIKEEEDVPSGFDNNHFAFHKHVGYFGERYGFDEDVDGLSDWEFKEGEGFENEFYVDRNVDGLDEHARVGENVVELSILEDDEDMLAVKEIDNVLDKNVSICEDVAELSKLEAEDEDMLAVKEIDNVLDKNVGICEDVAELSKLEVEDEDKLAVKEIDNALEEHVSIGEDVSQLSKLEIEDEDKLVDKGFENELDEQESVDENVADLSKSEVECEEIAGEKLEVKELDEHVSIGENFTELSKCEIECKEVDKDKLKVEELENELDESVQLVKDANMKEKIDVTELDVKISENDDELKEIKGIEIEEKSSIDENKSLLYGEDEWEGVEKSELEKQFGVAIEYAGSEDGGIALEKLSSDVKKQLYGLHKVATEGPCYEPQPLALKVTARAKWHSWQKLGNMNPEVAMERYITVLSENIPGWTGEKSGVEAKQGKGDDTLDAETFRTHESSVMHAQPTSSGSQRVVNDTSIAEVVRPTSGPSLFGKGLTSTFLFDLLSPTRVTFLTFYW